MGKKLLASILSISLIITIGGISAGDAVQKVQAADLTVKEQVIKKSTQGNPMLGFDENGDSIYGGDPSILVDGDTVYAYVGHDNSSGDSYVIPEYLCYSSEDMENWNYEGVIMNMKDVSWASDKTSAWAGQVAKYNDQYYLYYCTWNKLDAGKQSIGVAVSDSAAGPFVDIGEALVKGSATTPESSAWNDIDPTVWIETDEDGDEHRYLGWGNGKLYICELNEDMISVKDQNQDGKIDMADIVDSDISKLEFTEAPYFYRQQDENGNYYGQYYVFYAKGWREKMAYCTTDDLMSGVWKYGGEIMPPAATSNTNHPAVFDFKGKTYFVYHNGSLPGGSGYRRVACVEEFEINEDGSIDPIPETSTGITGKSSQIFNWNNEPVAHDNFTNPSTDSSYPIVADVGYSSAAKVEDATWEIVPGKADKEDDAYVSIESYNKPGLYLTARGDGIVLTQDTDASAGTANAMTFRTLEGFAGDGVTFESVAYPGTYITCLDGDLVLSETPNAADATFSIEGSEVLTSIQAIKTKRQYTVGDKLNIDDITATVYYDDGTKKGVTDYATDAANIDMSKAGTKTLKVSYTEKGITVTCSISITVAAKEVVEPKPIPTPVVPAQGKTYTKGYLIYKVTKSAAKNGEVAVTAPTKKTRKTIVIPATITLNGYTFKVTSIQQRAFKSNTKLKTVTIGKNIKSIGKNAFKGIQKKAVFKIPKSRYSAVKKLLTAKSGFVKRTMKLKKI